MKASEKILNKINNGFHICVGLDSDPDKIPPHLRATDLPILRFNKEIIDATKHGAAAYKLNFAFYESLGVEGISILKETVNYIPDEILIIGDAKRGDIENTSTMYAKAIFDILGFDAVTLNPYMGEDSVIPFLNYKEKLSFILALTSNKSSSDFEKLRLENGKYLFQEVIQKVRIWDNSGNCGIVFGATNLEELKSNIIDFGDLMVLIPGIGAQGGSVEEVVSVFNETNNKNFLLNISRSLIYSDTSTRFSDIVTLRINDYNQKIKQIFSQNYR